MCFSLERGSLNPVGEFVLIDFENIRTNELASLKDESFDLVSMMQGLHHLKPEDITPFLNAVRRILRPGSSTILCFFLLFFFV